jgi:hypothetical protein
MIKHHRKMFTTSGRRLRRARRLYVYLCRTAILEATTNEVIHRIYRRMLDSGLYASAHNTICWREGRYRILRYLYRLDGSPGSSGFGWSNWCFRYGYGHNFSKIEQTKQTA